MRKGTRKLFKGVKMTKSIIQIGVQKELELNKIKRNPFNNYDMDNLDELKNSIITNGLITPISVIGPSENDEYVLIAGERRFNIFSELAESGEERYQKMPVYVIGPINMDETEQKLLIESSNLDTRDGFDKNAHYLNVIKLLKQYKEENDIGCSEYVHMRGQYLKCSPRYARYYETIFNRGDDQLIEMVSSGEIGVSKAGRLAAIPKNLQVSAIEEIELGENPTEVVEKYRKIHKDGEKQKRNSFDFQDLDNDFEDFDDESFDQEEPDFNDEIDIDFTSMSTDFLNTGSMGNNSSRGNKYEFEMNTVLGWCKKILNVPEPTEDEWEVIDACKRVAENF